MEPPSQVNNGAVCLLVVNDVAEMLNISIKSILANTNASIFLGYKDLRDVRPYINHPRIELLNLEKEYNELELKGSSTSYSDWSDDDFFKIVQLKWSLLKNLLKLNYNFLIYSDLDVIWNADVYKKIESYFEVRPDKSMLIQSFTRDIDSPQLCMGLVAFRNNNLVKNFLDSSQVEHQVLSQSVARVGDDEITTQFYAKSGFPNWIVELPQTTFPVGVTIALFKSRNAFPGLNAQQPFIFHANYVVGIKNKVLLMKYFLGPRKRSQYGARFTAKQWLFLVTKRIKWNILLRFKY